MNLIKIKRQLQRSRIGRNLIKVYHYTISIPLTYIYRLKFYMSKNILSDLSFMDDEALLKDLREKHVSLCRFGDGEISWIYRDSKGYFGQENSLLLSVRLKEVLQSNHPNIYIAIPNFFGKMEGYDKRRIQSRNVHLAKYGKRWEALINSDRVYADALITRIYLGRFCDYDRMFNLWKSVWCKKDVVVVEGEDTKFGVGNDLLENASTVKRILVPSENAFSVYESILQTVKRYPKNSIYLLAIGPTATVLAYDLGLCGYLAIDIGHLDIEYEWYMQKALAKIPIKGKYVNEAGGLVENSEVPQSYLNQILDRII